MDCFVVAAMTGALLGDSVIPQTWRDRCEGVDDAEHQAEELFKLACNIGEESDDVTQL